MTDHYLIVNADDFGLSPGINRGIIEAHERGIVTSASLMVRYEAAVEAADYARSRSELSVGLHVDLGEWVCRDGEWSLLYEVVPFEDEAAVRREADAQLDRFRSLMGRDPTHLDSHQHLHQHEPLRTRLIEMAATLGLPLRHFTPGVRYNGRFYGQTGKGSPYPEGIKAESLVRYLGELPEGITELLCHPGLDTDHTSPYAGERLQEVRALCDPRIRIALDEGGIRLISFGDYLKMMDRKVSA